MCRTRRNPGRLSSFICLNCCNVNGIMIPRTKQREKYHIKDLYCSNCMATTKQLEVRSCDWMAEIQEKVPDLHNQYYDESGNLRVEYREEMIGK